MLGNPALFLLALFSVSVPAVILGELQTPLGPLCHLQKRSEGVLPAGGEGVCFYLLDTVEDRALHVPSALHSSGCHWEACARDDVPGRCVSDFWACCFWLQEHRVWVVQALAASVLLGSSVVITGSTVLWQP